MKENNKITEHIIPTMGRTNCGGRCRLLVTEKDGKIIDIKGDPNYPDKMPCIRGLNYHKTFLSEERLTTPLKRVGKRGEGKFEPISWEEAVDLITGEWIRIRDTYGPASRYVNYGWGVEALLNGTSLAKRLLRLDGGHLDYYNNYSTACTSYTTPYLYGTTRSGSSFDTLMDSRLIILWAHNPAETRFDNLMYWLRKAKRQGTEIIVIDPRRNATVDALGAEWIGIKPTTDSALMDAMAYVIWKEDLYDHEFVEEQCLGFDRYFAYLDGKEPGKEDGIVKNPAWASGITGIEEEIIINLARRYALAKPAALMQGYGGQRHMNGEQFTRGGIMLACLTGNVGISGGWASGAGQCSIVDLPTMPMIDNPVKAKIPVFMWTDAILNKGADNQGFGKAEGLQGAEKLDCGIKMILNLAGNILINQHSDINRTKKILEDESLCEFIVCSDLFMTPSARYSDLVLPATSMLESDNIVTPWNQGNFIGFCNKIVEPVGESRFEFDWLYEVAENLGLADSFACGHKDYNEWMRNIYEAYKQNQSNAVAKHQENPMPSYDELKKEGIYVFPHTPKVIGFEKQRQGKEPFPTPSGKVEIYSKELEQMNDPAIPSVPGYVEAEEGPGTSNKYPLQLIGWHTLGRTHSVHFNNEELKKKYPQLLWMNPADGKARGLKNEDRVEVFNDRGRLVVPVFLTESIVPGVTAIAQGAWHLADKSGCDLEGSVNILTTQKPTPLAKGNPQHTNLVEVKRYQKN